jgi:hypothetical protein
LPALDSSINSFIKELVNTYSAITEIWWIGSRANNHNIRQNSDWDFLVFTKDFLVPQLKVNKSLEEKSKRLNIDLLIESESDIFKTVWGQSKILRLKEDLKWKIISESKAKYYAIKFVEEEIEEQLFQDEWQRYFAEQGADVTSVGVSAWLNAIKIWPKT